MRLENLQNELNKIAEEYIDRYRNQLNINKVNATNLLNRSLSYSVNYLGGDYQVTLNLESYWKQIEEGSPIGTKVDVRKLVEWVKVKPVFPRGNKPMRPETLAYIIGRHIENNGIKARPLLQKATDEVGDFSDRIANAFLLDIEQLINK